MSILEISVHKFVILLLSIILISELGCRLEMFAFMPIGKISFNCFKKMIYQGQVRKCLFDVCLGSEILFTKFVEYKALLACKIEMC